MLCVPTSCHCSHFVLRKVSKRGLDRVIFINIFLPTPNRVTLKPEHSLDLSSHTYTPDTHTHTHNNNTRGFVNHFYFCQVDLESPFCTKYFKNIVVHTHHFQLCDSFLCPLSLHPSRLWSVHALCFRRSHL